MVPFASIILNGIQDVSRLITGRADLNSLHGRIAKRSVGTFGLMIASTCLSFVVMTFLARILGAKGYGSYTYAKTWITILSVPAALGLETLIIRNIAAYQTRTEWGLMKGLLRRANQIAFLVSFGLAFLAAAVSLGLEDHFDPEMLSAFRISLFMLPLIAFIRIRNSALQGLHHVVIGQLSVMVIQPILFIALIWIVYLLFEEKFTSSWAMGAHVVVVGVILLVAMRFLNAYLPESVREASPSYKTSEWMRSALPLLLVMSLYIIISATDILMLGSIMGAEPVGTYAIAKRGAGLIPFVMMAVNTSLAPTISSLYAKKDLLQLQHTVTRSIRVTFLITVPVAVGLAVFGDWFLQIFGRDFTQGKMALAILSSGELVNISMGSVPLLLIMTGHERDALFATGISAVLNVILNATLIPPLGANGAAAATAGSMVLLHIILAMYVYKRLGINSTVTGRIPCRRELS